jgi:hypothetical protein
VHKILAVALLTGALSASLAAGPIFGTFTIDGSVSVTATGITWTSNTSVHDQATISSLGLTGSFVGMANQTITIHDLTDTPGNQPVGVTFTNFDFLDFPVASGDPSLLANFLALGSGNPANCSTNPALAAAGQTCTLTPSTTPAEPGGSPFTFLNTSNGSGGCCNSSANWDISGITADGLSRFNAVFDSNFTSSYQTVLNNFATNGSVSDAFAGDLTVSIQGIPEPTTMALMGTGLILLSLGFRRRKRS